MIVSICICLLLRFLIKILNTNINVVFNNLYPLLMLFINFIENNVNTNNLYVSVVLLDSDIKQKYLDRFNDDESENDNFIYKCKTDEEYKGKNKRSYHSDDDENEYSKKSRESSYSYRDEYQEEESSNYTESNNSIEDEDDKNILILKRPEVIDTEIENIKENLNLIKNAKKLDDKLPSDKQWSNDNVLKLMNKGYTAFFDKSEESVKEGLGKLEKEIRRELNSSEKEKTRCTSAINSEGNTVKSWDHNSVWIKTSDEFFAGFYKNSSDSEEDTDVRASFKSKVNISEYNTSLDSNSAPSNKNKDSTEKNTNVLSSNVDVKNTSKSLTYVEEKQILSTNAEISSSKQAGSINTSPDDSLRKKDSSVSINNFKVEDKKLTPGNYIDDLPQDMPGFMDDID